jgi:hypothetical protein
MAKKIIKLSNGMEYRIASPSGRVLPRINFYDQSVFLELQDRAELLRVAHADLFNKDYREKQGAENQIAQDPFLDRVEKHVSAAGPIFCIDGAFVSWTSKDLSSWISLHGDSAGCVCQALVLLWLMGRIDLHCPILVKEAA